jgi:peptidoglycan/xylan/chitin deacetylase (PgdA/CDA1 family)
MYLSIWIGIVMSTSQNGCSVRPQQNPPKLSQKTEHRPATPAVRPQTGVALQNPNSNEPKDLPTGVRVRYTSVATDQMVLAMTFDDGPHPRHTPRLLDMLKQRNIKATFFVVGQCAREYPDIIRRIVAEGHEIGNHTYDHHSLTSMSDTQVRDELRRTDEAVFAASGYRMHLMRPPYGACNLRLNQMWFQEFNYPTILWSVDPFDWKKPGVAAVTSRIVNSAHKGSIILAHDIHESTVAAMPSTLDQLLAKGYRFLTVSQLLNLENKAGAVGAATPEQTPAAPAAAIAPSGSL